MFSFEEIEEFLSSQTKNNLNNIDSYNLYSKEAAQIIKDISNVDITPTDIKPDWAKIPFVFILEYLVYSKLNVPNPDNFNRIKDNYNIAIEICKKHIDITTVSKIGIIGDLYNVEF